MATNTLISLTSDIFLLCNQLGNENQRQQLSDQFYDNMVSLIDQFETNARQQGFSEDDIRLAKYALVAYTDELALSVSWQGGRSWMSKTLQWKYFNEHLAGEGFFKHLIDIRQQGESRRELIELYYICMQLGFDGIYRMRGLEAKQALLVDIKGQLDGYRRVKNNKLSGKSIIKQTVFNRFGQQIPYWSIASISVAVIFFIYLGFSMLIHQHANHSVKQLQHDQTTIQSIHGAVHE